MALIAISGKMQSGKNTVASIIQFLIDQCGQATLNGKPFGEPVGIKDCIEFIKSGEKLNYPDETSWNQKAFASKLKQIVSILTGIPVKDLEKQEVKERVLGEEWWHYKTPKGLISYKEYESLRPLVFMEHEVLLVKPTIRQTLQLCGTEAMRDVIHPNCWLNALFVDYTPKMTYDVKSAPTVKISETKYRVPRLPEIPKEHWDKIVGTRRVTWHENIVNNVYPNWIITDLRFPNELEAVKQRGGITIRVNRELPCEVCKFTKSERRNKVCGEITCPQGRENYQGNHESETALDHITDWDYVIDNNSSMEYLIEKVREILIKEKLI